MPFQSLSQERAAFSGALGEKMKEAAPEWAAKTDQANLPEHKGDDPKPKGDSKMDDQEKKEMSADDHTAAALHSALDACLAEDSDGHEKAKKMAKFIRAMHEGKEEPEAEPEKKEPEMKEEEKQEQERMEQTSTLAEPQIDRKLGILRHVHIAGMVSRNDGARYRMEGHRKAAPRFEGMPVGLDHDYSGAPLKVGQAFGVLSNITVEADGPYGDLQYLKTHERAEQVLEDAERKTGIFSLSMVAKTKGRGLDIEEYIPGRVDLVVRGATTRTLFHQQDAPVDMKREFDALNVRLEQLAAKNIELERRLSVRERFVATKERVEQQVETVTAGLDMSKFWNDPK